MATVFYMDNYTKQFQTAPPDLVPGAQAFGAMRRIKDEVTTNADFDSTDVIYAVKPPKGWRWSGLSEINHGALGTGVTLACGIAGATGKFLAAVDCAAAGVKKCNVQAGVDYEFDGGTPVIITIGGADCADAINVLAEFFFAATH